MEAGLVTLGKILATLILSIGIIPLLFLLSEGQRDEPQAFDREEH
ncbi:MAG TPA: hypothetical protein VGJ84_00340 [Polyangiaceae bacterium]|jgi:hypothetical protein